MARDNHSENDLKSVTASVESIVYFVSLLIHVGSAILTGACTFLYLSDQDTGFAATLLLSILIGGMTMAALAAFTTAAVKILPRLDARYLPASLLMGFCAVFAVGVVSGTSNGTTLGYPEARDLTFEDHRRNGESAFAAAQNNVRALEQILPILQTGRETVRALKAHEKQFGITGSGKGPVYAEMLLQETRLKSMEESLRRFGQTTAQDIRGGQRLLEDLRKSLKDPKLSTDDKRRALENTLTRLASLVIDLRQKMPLTSLKAVANMLRAPVRLSEYSEAEETRRSQEGMAARLHKEMSPIGEALDDALDKLHAQLSEDVPIYRHQSPTSMVFSHAGELFWILAVGYAIDILPYLALGLILLARRQMDDKREVPPPHGPQERPVIQLKSIPRGQRSRPRRQSKRLLPNDRRNKK